MKNNNTPDIRFAGFTEEWELCKLKDISKIYDGTHQTPKYTDSGIKFVSVEDINDIEASNKYISIEDYETQFKNKPEVGDIFMTRITAGIIGATAVVESDNPIAYYVSLALIKPSKKNSSIFLSSYISTKEFKKELNKRIIHTAFPKKINLSDIGECSISKPQKDEQIKIGNFFKQMDDTIALYQQELTTLKQTKQGFLQKMFPKEGESVPEVRFPGFTKKWEQRKLGEIMDVTSVKRIHQTDWTDKGVRFLRARDIVAASKNEEPSDYLYISVGKYNEYSKVSGKVSQGDLLVTGVGSIGVPMLVTDDEPIYFKDGNIIWFKNEHRIEGDFFYYSFKNNKIQKYIRDVAGIGTVGTYTIDSGKKTPISLPSYEEQTKIGNFLKQLDDTIALHQHELDALIETKKAFLQKMFV